MKGRHPLSLHLFVCLLPHPLSLHLFAWKRDTDKHEETEGEAIERQRGDRAGTEFCSFHSRHMPWQATENAQLRTASCDMAARLQQLTEDLARSEEQLSDVLAVQTDKDTQVEPTCTPQLNITACTESLFIQSFSSFYTTPTETIKRVC